VPSKTAFYLEQGIPTTRAGCIVTSDTKVVRDILYTGNPVEERASLVLRIAPTFFRFGSFEIFKATDPHTGEHTLTHAHISSRYTQHPASMIRHGLPFKAFFFDMLSFFVMR
jgi:uncharacterized protein YdiU (UPF0061 family)